MSELEAIRLTQGKILAELNRSKTARNLKDCEFSIFSQWGEDGIIQKLIAEIPIRQTTFIEFGVEDFYESNCRFLMMNDNWRGYVIDGSEKWIASLKRSNWWWKHDLRARCAIVTRENVNALLQGSGFDRDLGILSIDVDGVDYWLLEAIDSYAPRILILEYNSLFGSERKISVPYDDSFSRRQKHYSELYYGASLPALAYLAARKGYSLVAAESAGVNAFFVRNDLIEGNVSALTVDQAFVESMVRQSRDPSGRLNYLEREERYAEIKGMPVVNVETGETELL
jgi:hypothetical protein